MIIRARAVVTMDGPPIENGAVAVSGNRIIDVGKFPEISARHSGHTLVDLGEQALLPGLINAHCHLDYTCLRGQISPRKSFADWIRAINAEKARLSAQDYLASITEGFAEANVESEIAQSFESKCAVRKIIVTARRMHHMKFVSECFE